jgi:hypothetical protein
MVPVFSVCLVALATGDESAPREHHWSVSAFNELSGPGLTIEVSRNDDADVEYEPNNADAYGFAVRYKNYSASVGSPFFGTSKLDPERPQTKFLDLRLAWLDDRWGVEAYHQYHRGFYAMTTNYDTLLLDNPHMTLRSNVVNVYKAVGSFSQVSRMRDGLLHTGLGANVLLVMGVSRQSIISPSPILGTLDRARNTPYEGMSRLSYTGAYAGYGLSLNSNLFGFYFDPTLMIGFGLQSRDADVFVNQAGLQVKVNIKLQTGFATERVNFGMSGENDANSIELTDDQSVLFHSIVVRLFGKVSF